MRLNGWQRIGIAALIIWAIGAPIYTALARWIRAGFRPRP